MSAPWLTLLIGGVRAGKSARALSLATPHRGSGQALFVATAQAFDDEMRTRIEAHRRERSDGWETLESPLDPAEDIRRRLRDANKLPVSIIVLDCLTLWVSNVLLSLADGADAEAIVAGRTRELLNALKTSRTIVITNEVGLGVVPPTPLGRRYRDALGRANQVVADAADEVMLMVAGLEVPMKVPGSRLA